jgi:hypothetical protein
MLNDPKALRAWGPPLLYDDSGMTEEAKRVLEQALKLPPDSRAELAAGILASLEQETDGLSDDERERLHEALEEAHAELERGEGIPAAQVIAQLRARD